MKITLDDARTKLEWAKKHFETIRPYIEAFEERDNHTITCDINADEGKYTFHVHGLEPPDPDWGLQIGDCLHNARTALDYLLVRLVALVTGEEPKNVKTVSFPIFDEDSDFASKVGGLRKNPVLKHYVTRIEELQPFNMANPSIWGLNSFGAPIMALLPSALDRLSRLDNIDKHRVIHASWVGIRFNFESLPGIPPDFRQESASTSMGPLENDAEIGEIRFDTPLPHEWQPDDVDMKRHFRLQVGVADPLPVSGVLEVVPFCLWGVEAVLGLFDPVFTHGRPPLPVTAALSDEELYPRGYRGEDST